MDVLGFLPHKNLNMTFLRRAYLELRVSQRGVSRFFLIFICASIIHETVTGLLLELLAEKKTLHSNYIFQKEYLPKFQPRFDENDGIVVHFIVTLFVEAKKVPLKDVGELRSFQYIFFPF